MSFSCLCTAPFSTPLAHLSNLFQAGSVSFAAIGPAVNHTLEVLKTVRTEEATKCIQRDLSMDGRLSVCDLFSPLVH